VQVPYVEGKSYSDAVQALHDAELVAVRKNVNSKEPANTVLKQDTPQYTNVPPNTKVTLEVSTGKIELPDVRGLDFDNAQAKLNQAGFTNLALPPPTQKTTNSKKANEVAAQSPTPKMTYAPNQRITLTKYVYSPPAPTCTTPPPSPSTSPSTSPSRSASSSPSSSSSSPGGLPPCPSPSR
jgi:serine/threonine-protein kinase